MTGSARGLFLGAILLLPWQLRGEAVPRAQVAEKEIRLPVVGGEAMGFTRLSTADGLSQTRVSQIVQDDQGFIWFGTQYGLNRYDGYNFKVFVHDPRRPESMGGAFVTALFKDRAGSLWVACPQTLDRYDPVTETFEHFALCPKDGEKPGTVVHISEDRDGFLWLSTGAGLHRLNPGTGEIEHFPHTPDDPTSLSSNDVKSSGEDREGSFWVGTSEGLDRFDRKTGRVTLHVPLKDPVQISFFEDRRGNFWIYHASGSGLALLDRKTGQLTHYTFYDQFPGANELTGVMGMVEDQRGNLWLGSPGRGLLRLDRDGQRFVSFKNNPADLETIAEDKVIALFEDREGNVWTGLHSSGPNHFHPKPPLFETFRREPGNPNGLEMDFINAMFEDSRGFLWIGNDLGVTRIDRKTGESTRFSQGLGLKPMVITVAEDRGGNIWVGTYGHGMARLDQKTGIFKTYTHREGDPRSLCNDQVHRLFVDHEGTLWAATDDGLSRFDPATETFTTYQVSPGDRNAQAYVAIAEDRQGRLWLGTHYSGLHRFDPKTGKFVIYQADPNVPGSLRDDMVPAVHINARGEIWVGTQNGLDKFDPETEKFTPIFESRQRAGSTVSCILEDRQGNLWISSNNGLAMFDPETGIFRSYSAVDGLPGNDLTGWGTGFQGSDGEMFFGGFAGGIAFFPEKLVESSYSPPVVLTDFRLPFLSPEEKKITAGKTAITFARRLMLPHEASSFALEFSALSYFNPPANRYRYKLEGLDDRWSEVESDQRVATYTTLPAGKYTFHVQGATGRGDWSEPGVVLPIQILPAWWETWWFRAGMGLAFAGMLFIGFRARVSQIKEREREFRKLAENAPDMVMRFDANLRVLYANPTAELFVGQAGSGMVGRPLREFAARKLPVTAPALEKALKKGEPSTEEIQIPGPEGGLFFETRIVPEFGVAHSAPTALVVVRDITSRRRAEEELRKSQSALAHVSRVTTVGELAASIAHEVNQPLTGIVTNGNACLRWLGMTPPNLHEASESVTRIVRDGKRAADIITRIRALVRKTAAEMSPLDINGAVREVAQLLDGEVRRNQVALVFDLDENLPLVLGDRVQLQQVVLNLLMNAIEAMAGSNERALRITSRRDDGKDALLSVADSGPGIDAKSREDIFEAFFTTKPSGMGMGLAISRSIIEAHGGKLQAEANQPHGTVFHFTLPFAEPR